MVGSDTRLPKKVTRQERRDPGLASCKVHCGSGAWRRGAIDISCTEYWALGASHYLTCCPHQLFFVEILAVTQRSTFKHECGLVHQPLSVNIMSSRSACPE